MSLLLMRVSMSYESRCSRCFCMQFFRGFLSLLLHRLSSTTINTLHCSGYCEQLPETARADVLVDRPIRVRYMHNVFDITRFLCGDFVL